MPEIPDFATLETQEPGTGRHLGMAFGTYAGDPTAALFVGDSEEPILLPMGFLIDAVCQTATCEYDGCTNHAIGSFTVDNETVELCEIHADEVLVERFPAAVARWIVAGDGTVRPEVDVEGL